MLINGKEYGFFYDVAAKCDYEDILVKNPDMGMSRANVKLACIMNREYNRANGIKDPILKEDEVMHLPARVYQELEDVIRAQIAIDTEVTVETTEGKGKAAGKGK